MLKVPYNSDNPLVRYCLANKQYHCKYTMGIGPHSCCAMVEYQKNGMSYYSFGNSQEKNELDYDSKYKDDMIKCHGESTAIFRAINAISSSVSTGVDLSVITKVYVELSPCLARCADFLKNVNPKAVIMYTFDHPTEIAAWKKAASELASAASIDVSSIKLL